MILRLDKLTYPGKKIEVTLKSRSPQGDAEGVISRLFQNPVVTQDVERARHAAKCIRSQANVVPANGCSR
jgi:hypothetical protein